VSRSGGRKRPLAALGLLGALALVPPAAAESAYSPKLAYTLDPPAPGVAPAVTSTVTQPQGESATKRARISFPPQFGFNPGFAVRGCTAEEEEAAACPEESRIGRASAQNAFGTFTGPVFFSADYRVLIYLRDSSGAISIKVVGTFHVRPDGGYDSVFDDLPNFPTPSFTLNLDGGSRSPQLTPRVCGDYVITATFTSWQGEQATSTAPAPISGCAASVAAARVKPTRVRPGAGTRISWQLTASAASTRLRVERRDGRRWKRIGSIAGPAVSGANVLDFAGRLAGRELRLGSYRIVVSAVAASGAVSGRRDVRFTVAR
jgi:hypothetical protein